MLTRISIEALLVDEPLADQVWDRADARRIGSDVVVDIGGLAGDYSANYLGRLRVEIRVTKRK